MVIVGDGGGGDVVGDCGGEGGDLRRNWRWRRKIRRGRRGNKGWIWEYNEDMDFDIVMVGKWRT